MSRRTLLRGAAAGGVLLGGVTLPTTAAHAAPAPRCYTRTEWSARPPRSATQVIGAPDHIGTYGLDPHAAIVGHRDYNATQCPGNVFYARLPELRDRVAAVLG